MVKEINPNQNKIDVIALIYKTLKTQNHGENNQGYIELQNYYAQYTLRSYHI